MKKVLLGTTALVAATAMTVDAAKAEISVSTWAYQSFGLALDSDPATSEDEGLVSYQNANIDFKGSTELDNGMTAAITIDMQAATANTSIDEMRFSLSDDWGTLDLGGNDTAADIMNHANHWVTGNGVDSGTFSAYATNYYGTSAGLGGFMATASSLIGDAAGIRYFSPSMNGFRVGVSYQGDGDNENSANSSNNSLANVFSAAVEYAGDMDGIGFDVGVGVEHAASTSFEGAGGDDDASSYHVGGSIGTAGFSLGLGYAARDYKTSSTAQVDAWTFAATASYSTGPHTIGVEYVTTEATPTVGGSDVEGDGYLIGYSNSLGNGVYWDARIALIEVDGATAGSNTDDADVTVFETGIGVSF